jgi:hypothetical protein
MRTRWEIGSMEIQEMWRMIAAIGLLTLILTTAARGTLVGAGVGAAGGALCGPLDAELQNHTQHRMGVPS